MQIFEQKSFFFACFFSISLRQRSFASLFSPKVAGYIFVVFMLSFALHFLHFPSAPHSSKSDWRGEGNRLLPSKRDGWRGAKPTESQMGD
jgi:hypothetical protein